ncbi:MAG: SRPBCC family protein [Pseudonocardia sp.]|nr:SRPBCC family protein [Pseudonocardia sp.]
MVHVIRTFTVDRPAPTVLAYLSDFAHAEQWDPGTQSCTRVDDGPIRVGATWHNVSKILGKSTELEYRLEQLDDEHLVLVGRNKTATSTDDITVVPHELGAEITYEATVELHGVAKLGSPIMQLEFDKLGDETVSGIRDAVAALP